jgi:hypothetical protein
VKSLQERAAAKSLMDAATAEFLNTTISDALE